MWHKVKNSEVPSFKLDFATLFTFRDIVYHWPNVTISPAEPSWCSSSWNSTKFERLFEDHHNFYIPAIQWALSDDVSVVFMVVLVKWLYNPNFRRLSPKFCCSLTFSICLCSNPAKRSRQKSLTITLVLLGFNNNNTLTTWVNHYQKDKSFWILLK